MNNIMLDIEKHFSARLNLLIEDIIDTCYHADIDRREIILLVMSSLWFELTKGGHALGMTEKQFLASSKMVWKAMGERIAAQRQAQES